MEKSYRAFGILTGFLALTVFSTLSQIAPEMPEVIMRVGRGHSIGFLVFEGFLLALLMFLVGLPFSKIFFKDIEVFERIFTSFMISFVFYGFFYMLVYFWEGLFNLYFLESHLMFFWTLTMAVIGYGGVWLRGGDIDV